MTAGIKFGVSIPNNWGMASPHDVAACAVSAEECGFNSVWVAEHLVNAGYLSDRLGDAPYYDPLAMLTYLAAATKHISLATGVIVVPFHNPVQLAKYCATLDHLSSGRLILGVGSGGNRDEFAAVGIPFAGRGSVAEVSLAVMRTLWSGGCLPGSEVQPGSRPIIASPRPFDATIPVWWGGNGPAARRRAGTFYDGWHPTGLVPEEFAAGAREVRDIAADSGRDPDDVVLSIRVNVELDALPPGSLERRDSLMHLTEREHAIDVIGSLWSVGASHIVFALNTSDLAAYRDALGILTEDILKPLKSEQIALRATKHGISAG